MKKLVTLFAIIAISMSFSITAFATQESENCIFELWNHSSNEVEEEYKEYIVFDGQGWLDEDPLAYRKLTQKVEKGNRLFPYIESRTVKNSDGSRVIEKKVKGEKDWFVYDYKLGVDENDYIIVVSEDEKKLILIEAEEGYKVFEIMDFGGMYIYRIESKKIDYFSQSGKVFRIDLRTFEVSQLKKLIDVLPTEVFVGRY